MFLSTIGVKKAVVCAVLSGIVHIKDPLLLIRVAHIVVVDSSNAI